MAIRMALVRRVGAALLLLESAALGLASLWFCYELVAAKPKHLLAALIELVFFVLFGTVLFLAGKQLPTGPQATRTPALLINIIALPISYYLIQAGRALIAIPIAVVATIASIALISAEK